MEKVIIALVALLLAYGGGVFTVSNINRRRKSKASGALQGDIDSNYSQLRSELQLDREQLERERVSLTEERDYLGRERQRLITEREYIESERERLDRERKSLESTRKHISDLIRTDGKTE